MKRKHITGAVLLVAALALAGCNGTIEDLAPKAEKQLPAKLVEQMRAKGMSRNAPIMVRIFKEEARLEVWKRKDNGRYDLAAGYDICKWSGQLGPKYTEGDRQAPEGFYSIRPHQMNPNSSYHLAFNMGFPNNYDRAHGRTGQHLMVHGACSSAGCYSMTDPQMEQIYAFARDAFKGGQTEFQVQAFPFRMTAENMARYKGDPNYPFWQMLKEGYDHFEISKIPPKVDVCGKQYVFNQHFDANARLSATAACPVSTQPDNVRMAYQSYQANFDRTMAAIRESSASKRPLSETIDGFKEASLVADWSRRRARGESVSREPPSINPAPASVASIPQTVPQAVAAPAAQAGVSAMTTATTPPAAAEAAPVPTPNPAATEMAVPEGPKRSRLWGMFSR